MLLRLGGICQKPLAAALAGTALCLSTLGVLVRAFVLANNDRRAEDHAERMDRSAKQHATDAETTTSSVEEGGGSQQQEGAPDADAAIQSMIPQACLPTHEERGSRLEEESANAPPKPDEDESSPSAWLTRVVGGHLCLEDQRNAEESL